VVLRQVFYQAKPNQVQSEIGLTYMNPKNAKYQESMKTQSVFMPSKKQRKVVFDFDTLACEYHQTMIAGLSLVDWTDRKEPLRMLVCGTGAGVLPMFIRQNFDAKLGHL